MITTRETILSITLSISDKWKQSKNAVRRKVKENIGYEAHPRRNEWLDANRHRRANCNT